MQKVSIFIFFLVISLNIEAQQYYSKVFDFDGIGSSDRFKLMIENDGFLYLLASYAYINDNDERTTATKVVKTDVDGNILQERDFLWLIEQTDYGINMLIEDDHLYILNHYEFDYAIDKNPINLLKLDLDLDSIALIEYDPFDINPMEAADASLTSFKDHFVATGWIDNDDNMTDGEQPFIMWINKGDLTLDTVYTFPSHVINPEVSRVQMPYALSNNDNSVLYIFSELITRNPSEVFNRQEIGFLKYTSREDQNVEYIADTLGTYSFHNTPYLTSEGLLFYEKEGDDFGDNEFVLMESDGTVLWHNKDITVSSYGKKTIFHFTETEDGDLIAGGSASWYFEYGQEDPDTISHFNAPYLIKLDIETGEILWERYIIDYDDYGQVNSGRFLNVVETPEGDLICAGRKTYRNPEFVIFTSDSWLLRLDENGCHPDYACDPFSFISSLEENDYTLLTTSSLKISPNPTDGPLLVSLPVSKKGGIINVRDQYGKLVFSENVDRMLSDYSLDLSSFPSGIYFIN